MKHFISLITVTLMCILSACDNKESFSSNDLAFFDLRGSVSDVSVLKAETDDSFAVPDTLLLVEYAVFEDGELSYYQTDADTICDVVADDEGRINTIVSCYISAEGDSITDARIYQYGEHMMPDTLVSVIGPRGEVENGEAKIKCEVKVRYYDEDDNLSTEQGSSFFMVDPDSRDEFLISYQIVEQDDHGNWTLRNVTVLYLEKGDFQKWSSENPVLNSYDQKYYVEQRVINYVGEE